MKPWFWLISLFSSPEIEDPYFVKMLGSEGDRAWAQRLWDEQAVTRAEKHGWVLKLSIFLEPLESEKY